MSTNLRELLRTSFNLEDLQSISFDLAIDFEDLGPPGSKTTRIEQLILYCQQNGRLDDLLAVVRRRRPNLPWPESSQAVLAQVALMGRPVKPPQPFEPEMVLVPSGPFLMGSLPGEEIPTHEQPQHQVELPTFKIGKYPVTQEQYARFVKQRRHPKPEKIGWFGLRPPKKMANHPIVNISWFDALAYCRWLSEETGRLYRLPTEAEWEKAARGDTGQLYPWGDGWSEQKCNVGAELTAVDAYPDGQSPYGCWDMAGNCAEWVSTVWGNEWLASDFPYPYRADDGREAPLEQDRTDTDPVHRLFRGLITSQHLADPLRVRCAARGWYAPDSHDKRRGFRVVLVS